MHIHFSNLNIETTYADMNDLLKNYPSKGNCAICYIKDAVTREVATYALVDMSDSIEMHQAVKLLDGSTIRGYQLTLQIGQ